MEELGSIEAVLEFAIEREIEANEFYKGLSNRVKDTAMREVFENFAKEELGHKAKLEAMKAGGKKAVSEEGVVDLKITDYLVDVEPSDDMDYKDALILAMKRRRRLLHFTRICRGRLRVWSRRRCFRRWRRRRRGTSFGLSLSMMRWF